MWLGPPRRRSCRRCSWLLVVRLNENDAVPMRLRGSVVVAALRRVMMIVMSGSGQTTHLMGPSGVSSVAGEALHRQQTRVPVVALPIFSSSPLRLSIARRRCRPQEKAEAKEEKNRTGRNEIGGSPSTHRRRLPAATSMIPPPFPFVPITKIQDHEKNCQVIKVAWRMSTMQEQTHQMRRIEAVLSDMRRSRRRMSGLREAVTMVKQA